MSLTRNTPFDLISDKAGTVEMIGGMRWDEEYGGRLEKKNVEAGEMINMGGDEKRNTER